MKDLTNLEKGNLTVLGIAYTKRSSISNKTAIFWKCRCKCGNVKDIRGDHLRSGHTTSCGCLRKSTCQLLGDKNRKCLTKEDTSLLYLFNKVKYQSKVRGIEFKLSFDEFLKLSRENCYYCNVAPQERKVHNHGRAMILVCNGIDRVDSNGNYDSNNTVSCCHQCNISKYILTQPEFYNWVSRVYTNLQTKGIIPLDNL